ncbi:YitT family protein [Lacticigenium naphthae]|uniref:YitT family protein n=1 Tax=Lacticigenium naphthae TaxID=515351 RepID=UPI0004193460|nr:YitT family protein [Lacticigenium naphthae]
MTRIAKMYKFNFVDIIYIIAGSVIAALSFQVFLLPNNIVSGGVSGFSIVVNSLWGWSPAIVQYAINIPLLVLCFWLLGKSAGYKTILGSLLLPLLIGIMSPLEPLTQDPLLASVFGGLTTGIGLGIVFRSKASTGGTSILAQIIYEYGHLPLGISTAIVDGTIIFFALIAFDIETVMFSLITLFVISRTIDLMQVGLNRAKNVFIISDSPQDIREEILHTMRRGVTNLGVKGGYGNTEKDMLMVVIAEHEFTMLKDTVLEADPDAFVVVMGASEVMGRGFTLHKNFGGAPDAEYLS